MPRTPDPDLVASARTLYEQGMSLRDIGTRVGVSRESVRRWAAAGEWPAPVLMPGADRRPKPIPTAEEIEAARLRAEKAQQEARARWGVRRSQEADDVGTAASKVRETVMTLLAEGKVAEARLASQVYATFIDRANLLSGDAIPSGARRQGDEDGPSVHGPRPTDPRDMAAAGRQRALQLVPSVDVESREKQG